MRKPGKQKRRPRGGGAAGRAYQFELERGVENKEVDGEDQKEFSAEDLQRKVSGSKSTKTSRASAKPK